MLDCPSMMGLPTRRGTEPAFFTLYIHQRSCPARRIPNLSEQNGTKMIQVYSLKKAILCRPDIRTTSAATNRSQSPLEGRPAFGGERPRDGDGEVVQRH